MDCRSNDSSRICLLGVRLDRSGNGTPTVGAISNIEVASVQTTFWMFAVLFTVLLIAEVGIMLKQIKKGTEQK